MGLSTFTSWELFIFCRVSKIGTEVTGEGYNVQPFFVVLTVKNGDLKDIYWKTNGSMNGLWGNHY